MWPLYVLSRGSQLGCYESESASVSVEYGFYVTFGNEFVASGG